MADGMHIEVDGSALVKAAAALKASAAPIIQREFKGATIESLAYAQEFLANYPPEPEGSTYTRTTTLGPNWRFMLDKVSANAGEVRGLLFNQVSYAIWVQDEQYQARIHRGRWPTTQMLERVPAKKMAGFFRAAVDRAAKALVKLVGVGKP